MPLCNMLMKTTHIGNLETIITLKLSNRSASSRSETLQLLEGTEVRPRSSDVSGARVSLPGTGITDITVTNTFSFDEKI